MKFFRRRTDADPRIVTILPYRDLRTQNVIDKALQAEYDRRVAARERANEDRRRRQAVDMIAVEYAEELAPSILKLQAG
jgi:hypothetical protein